MAANISNSDGRVVRASASEAVDSGVIPSQGEPVILKLIFTASLLGAQQSALKGQCGKQARKFACCAVGKGT